jgi:O-antigen/teichoic acid export membrane protein
MRRLLRASPGASRALIGSVATGFVGQLALVASGVLVARGLGPQNRGYLALLVLVPTLISELGTLGFPLSATFYLAKDPAQSTRIIKRVLRVAAIQALVLTVAHAVALFFITRHDAQDVRAAAVVTLAVVPGYLAQRYGVAILQGQRRFAAFNFYRVLAASVYSLAIVPLYVLGTISLLVVTIVWSVGNLGVGFATLLAVGKGSGNQDVDGSPSLRAMFRFGARGFIGAASPLETFRLDQAVIGLFLTPIALGLYVVAMAFTNLPRFIAQSIGMVAYPHIAAQGDGSTAKRSLWNFFWLSVLASGVVVVGLEVLTGRLVPLFFGHAFDSAVTPARILLVSALLFGARRVLADAARGIGAPGAGTAAEVISWVALPPTLAVFVPLWGINGVAVSIVCAAALSLVGLVCLVQLSGQRRKFVKRFHQLGAATPALLAIVIGAGVAYSTSAACLSVNIALACGTLVVSLWPTLSRIRSSTFDIFEPIVGAGLTLAILFGVRPLYMLSTGSSDYLGHSISGTLGLATALGFVGTTSFVVAYGAAASGRVRRPHAWPSSHRTDTNVLHVVAPVMGALGVGLFLIFLGRSGSVLGSLSLLAHGRSPAVANLQEGTTQYLSASPVLLAIVATLVIVATAGRAMTAAERWLTGAAVLFPLGVFALYGDRRFIIACFFTPLVAYYLSRNRRPSSKRLLLILPVAFLIFATIPTARSAGARHESGGLTGIFRHAAEKPAHVWHTFIAGPDTDMIAALAVEVQSLKHPDDFTYGGATIGDLAIAPIPSAVFPGKPMPASDRLLTKTFGGRCDPIRGLCPDFSAVGTFFQDLWIPGVVLGMALLGIASAVLWRRLVAQPDDPYRQALAGCWLVFVPVILRAGFMPAFSWFLYFAVPLMLCMKLVVAYSRHRSAPAVVPIAHATHFNPTPASIR